MCFEYVWNVLEKNYYCKGITVVIIINYIFRPAEMKKILGGLSIM